ncbi:MAG: hypothetical protein E7130_07530 [Rikenellaceae bacterium]|nr:hypothetical protein [Rikenellaceae bacterium]MBQ7341708.1 hypothetical protein [Alistipes sp.]
MKLRVTYILMAATAIFASCTKDSIVEFGTNRKEISVGAVGGHEIVRVASSDEWIASTDKPWITVSPANGRGSTPCTFIIDSALVTEPRSGVVRIQNVATKEHTDITVTQEGFPYFIEVEEPAVEIANYDSYGERWFDVKVRSNVDFKVDIPVNDNWLKCDKFTLNLNRGVRPREVTLRFNWDINTSPRERIAEIALRPKTSGITLERQDNLSVTQAAAEPIIENTRQGDSVALICIARSLNTMTSWDTSSSMDMWNNVTLWKEGMEGYTEDKEGRVRSAKFTLFFTKEPLPFEVRYLTAAEELYFFGNANTFLLSLSTGDDIAALTQLKRLTIGAYGLTELPTSFTALRNLEYLNIGSNNFMSVPEILTPEKFPNLRTLIMNANQRHAIYDLSNTVKSNIGGFIEEAEFPKRLLKWNKLDTLVLSVNYLHGSLPDFADDDEVPTWSREEVEAVDSLPDILIGKKKVMPTTKMLAFNYNRLTGSLPEWLLYHPALNIWQPYSFIFNQEGRTKTGIPAGFDNEPVNMDYYYTLYPTKNKPTGEDEVTDSIK